LNRSCCIQSEYITIKRSGIFDADFYLQEYPDVRKADIDPLRHFIRFGWKEGRRPAKEFFTSPYVVQHHSKKGLPQNYHKFETKEDLKHTTNFTGQHIEFIGVPGSGKTTLYNQFNLFLHKELDYKPGPTCLFMDILKDGKYQALMGNDSFFLTSFLFSNKAFVNAVFKSDKLLQYPEQLHDMRDIVMAYLFNLFVYYQARTTTAPNEWIMFDEGFYYFLAKFIIDENGKIKGRIANRLLGSMPKADLLIHVKTDISVCIQRMKMRKQGIPHPYQELSSSQLEYHFELHDNFIDKYCAVVKAQGIKTIELDNNQPIEKSISKLSSESKCLL